VEPRAPAALLSIQAGQNGQGGRTPARADAGDAVQSKAEILKRRGRPPDSPDTDTELDGAIAREWFTNTYKTKADLAAKLPAKLKLARPLRCAG
jgi:hypothetical protein